MLLDRRALLILMLLLCSACCIHRYGYGQRTSGVCDTPPPASPLYDSGDDEPTEPSSVINALAGAGSCSTDATAMQCALGSLMYACTQV